MEYIFRSCICRTSWNEKHNSCRRHIHIFASYCAKIDNKTKSVQKIGWKSSFRVGWYIIADGRYDVFAANRQTHCFMTLRPRRDGESQKLHSISDICKEPPRLSSFRLAQPALFHPPSFLQFFFIPFFSSLHILGNFSTDEIYMYRAQAESNIRRNRKSPATKIVRA